MRLLHLVVILGFIFAASQYSKNFEVPVAAAQQRKPASIKELLANLSPKKARGYVFRNSTYTRVELEPGKNQMIIKFFPANSPVKEYVVYGLTTKANDDTTLSGTFTQGSLLYLTYITRPNNDRVYSGWIISPDRTVAAPLAVLERAQEVAGGGWPAELELSGFMSQLQ